MNKQLFLTIIAVVICGSLQAQNVGIGNGAPTMKLHITTADSSLLLLENSLSLNTDISTGMYFKTGNGPFPFTGALKSVGENAFNARLGLFTYTSPSPFGLLERMSILDDGRTGINTTTPLMRLHVANPDSATALLENTQALNTNVSNGLYFKTGTSTYQYTSAIKSIGQNAAAARLGFFTFASPTTGGLLERMSIADNGSVGIGTILPQANLHIDPKGGGGLLVGTNRTSGGFTTIEMGVAAQSNSYGYLQTTRASGTSYGDLVINQSGGNVTIGTTQGSLETKLTVSHNSGTNYNYSGITATARGAAPYAAIKAQGTAGADALVIDGPIRTLNTEQRVIYQLKAQKNDVNGDGYLYDNFEGLPGKPDGTVSIRIDNPLCNNDPTAIIMYSFVGFYQNNKNYQSYLVYDFAFQKWAVQYKYDVYVGSPSSSYAPVLNIMIIKQ